MIPAGGQGTRLGGEPKQFRQLGGAPLLLQTARAFERHKEIKFIVVAVPIPYLQRTRAFLGTLKKLQDVVRGGGTRRISVSNALKRVPADADLVLVHDAARPFVDKHLITEVVRGATLHGAAAAAIPVADTLRYGDGDRLSHTVPRDGLYAMQTPQGFRKEILDEAYASPALEKVVATDDAELVCQMGQAVHIVPGRPNNIKIATSEDWDWAVHTWQVFESSKER